MAEGVGNKNLSHMPWAPQGTRAPPQAPRMRDKFLLPTLLAIKQLNSPGAQSWGVCVLPLSVETAHKIDNMSTLPLSFYFSLFIVYRYSI